ncbi:MAG TPA: hypothetical protein VE866_12765, partial [Candidatus Binatia bacterium]|nr:hypothetical protein [Candidatus Binatia bacterium]
MSGKSSRTAGLLINVAVEDVKKLGAKIDHTPFAYPCLLPYGDGLISRTERTRAGESSILIPERKGSRGCKGIRIEERRSQRIQPPAICLFDSGY